MERDRPLGPQPLPCWSTQYSPVDQYSFRCRQYPGYGCPNDLMVSTYNCQGNISFSLPLTRYPSESDPFPAPRDPFMGRGLALDRQYSAGMRQDLADGRLSSFYYYP